MEKLLLSNLFIKAPANWGLRGDPYLWDEMMLRIDSLKRPKTVDDFEKILNNLFLNLTGEEIGKNKEIYVERHSQGGMSSGFISSEFWTETAFKILVERFSKMINE